MRNLIILVIIITVFFSCKKKKIEPKLKNVLFTAHITTFKNGTTWTVIDNPNINNNK